MDPDASHRPWPPPGKPWRIRMRWHDLLFAHWPLDPAAVRRRLPSSLDVDTFEGRAWLGIVPFRMTAVRPRGVPSLPGLSAFGELNVRTYATAGGRPGIWFFSLEAANPIAVRVARTVFHLPYFDARISSVARGGWINYRCRRTHRGAPPAIFEARYRPIGPVAPAERGTLDRWLTERYCLYAADRGGRVYRGEIDHEPWPLQRAEAEIARSEMTDLLPVMGPSVAPLLHFAGTLDVRAWPVERIE